MTGTPAERRVDGVADSIIDVQGEANDINDPMTTKRSVSNTVPGDTSFSLSAVDARLARLEALVGSIATRVDSLIEGTPRTPSASASRNPVPDAATLVAAEGEVLRLKRQVDALLEQRRQLLQQLLQLALQQLHEA